MPSLRTKRYLRRSTSTASRTPPAKRSRSSVDRNASSSTSAASDASPPSLRTKRYLRRSTSRVHDKSDTQEESSVASCVCETGVPTRARPATRQQQQPIETRAPLAAPPAGAIYRFTVDVGETCEWQPQMMNE